MNVNLGLHNIEKMVYKKKYFKADEGKDNDFFVMELNFHDKDGNVYQVNIFGDNECEIIELDN